jgi:hypothetical protein
MGWSDLLGGVSYSTVLSPHTNTRIYLRHEVWQCGLISSGSRQRPVQDTCDYGNESSGSIKYVKNFDQLNDSLLRWTEFHEVSNYLPLIPYL